MKTNCEIIRDLLPLYAEGVASEDSKKLVDEHLAGCPACREELARMQKPLPVKPEETAAEPLKKVRRAISAKRLRTVLFTCLVTALAVGGLFTLCMWETPVTFDEAQVTVTPVEGTAPCYEFTSQDERIRFSLVGDVYGSSLMLSPKRVTRLHVWLEPLIDSLLDNHVKMFRMDGEEVAAFYCEDDIVFYSNGEIINRVEKAEMNGR